MNWATIKFNLFGDLPVVGKQVSLSYYSSVMDRILFIEKQFNKPMVTFDANVHALYDCLQGSKIVMHEDFDWFLVLGITTYTKTSALTSQFFQRILNGELLKYDDYFKELNVSSRETAFLDWYSNFEDTQEFLGVFLGLMHMFCLENPIDEEGEIYKGNNRLEINRSTLEFINSSHFRLVLDDFITVMKLSIDSQVRRLNGEAN